MIYQNIVNQSFNMIFADDRWYAVILKDGRRYSDMPLQSHEEALQLGITSWMGVMNAHIKFFVAMFIKKQ